MKLPLFIPGSFTADAAALIALAAFVVGYLIKYGVLLKQRKRILRLEDEMLANHARILALEKRASEAKRNTIAAAPEFEIIPAAKKTSAAS